MAEEQNIMVLGLGTDGENNVVLHLFQSAVSQFMLASEWAKGHPDVEHVEVILHGTKPDALILTLPRAVLLSMAAEAVRQEQGITLQ